MRLLSDVIETISGNSSEKGAEISRTVSQALESALVELMERAEDIRGAMVSSVDGVAWAQRLADGFDEHRFAAMSSAMLALSDTLATEGGSGATENVLVEGEAGRVFIMHAGPTLLLTVFTEPGVNLGMSLACARQTSEKIGFLIIDS